MTSSGKISKISEERRSTTNFKAIPGIPCALALSECIVLRRNELQIICGVSSMYGPFYNVLWVNFRLAADGLEKIND